ncbi:hypothetical protein [Candidatus Phytoplasma meliae]|uniref:Immunodominant membrane protein n=1 Tax=Candidatus Phytoplasma meliae TaxID=1848402 RepID=A0ABS5CXE0_9MOLU|nr:hypothetical protein [Candidatus Phytoplasma meliae]MBP5835638.1 hypothetical protein [Candidatus Phytoplasma meliae]
MTKLKKINQTLFTIFLITGITLFILAIYNLYQYQTSQTSVQNHLNSEITHSFNHLNVELSKTTNHLNSEIAKTSTHLNQQIDNLYNDITTTKTQTLNKIENNVDIKIQQFKQLILDQIEKLIIFLNNKVDTYLDPQSKEEIINCLKNIIENFGSFTLKDLYSYFKSPKK